MRNAELSDGFENLREEVTCVLTPAGAKDVDGFPHALTVLGNKKHLHDVFGPTGQEESCQFSTYYGTRRICHSHPRPAQSISIGLVVGTKNAMATHMNGQVGLFAARLSVDSFLALPRSTLYLQEGDSCAQCSGVPREQWGPSSISTDINKTSVWRECKNDHRTQ